MNRKTNRKLLVFILCGTVYLLLLQLLTFAERSHPDSSIKTIADAFWYSVVTISTVGYGDMYPLTIFGKCLGLIFVILSVGLLSYVIGTMLKVLTGSMLPALQLRILRNREWFVFSCLNSEVGALVLDLAGRHPDAVFLFPKGEENYLPDHIQSIFYPGTMAQVTAGKRDKCSLFFLNTANCDAYEKAAAVLDLGFHVYCLTEFAPDNYPQNLTLVNHYDCCAREYWRTNGLCKSEHTVLLIGDGKYARHLLSRGLLVNVRNPEYPTSYHVFGDWENYRRNHHKLDSTISVGRSDPEMDSLIFHQDTWNADPDLLADADRIIICSDDPTENMMLLRHLRKYFPTKAKLHLRSTEPIFGEYTFGEASKVYTEELILGTQLFKAARIMHQIYRDSTGGTAPSWDELNEFLRQSNIAAADHLLVKIRILLDNDNISEITVENCHNAYRNYWQNQHLRDYYRRIEHLRWMRFHSMYNWTYASVRDNPVRKHPMMLPFDALSESEQQKDDYAWDLLKELSEYLRKC